MPPVAPIITVTADTANGRIGIVFNNGVSTVDSNNLYRDGVKISALIPDDGTFYDYGAVHGVNHTYVGEAISGADAVMGASKNGTLTLSSAWIHSVSKYLTTSNAVDALALLDLAPQQQGYALATQVYSVGNAPLPVVGVGSIESGQVDFIAVVLVSDLADFAVLEDIFRSSQYLCLRDVRGNKWFGRLPGFPQSYNFGYCTFSFSLDVLTFNERVD